MLAALTQRDARDWEELALREPYFRVLTNDHSVDVAGSASATAAFFATGETDISMLLAALAALQGRPLRLTRVLDFGCGAGRLTLPLARRSGSVVGCDIAPTILAHARLNALEAGVSNATFLTVPELGRLSAGEFDFICSLLVFQHIAPSLGYDLLRTLTRLLARGGVGAIQVKFRSPVDVLRQRAGQMRDRSSRVFHARRGVARSLRRLSSLRADEYDEQTVREVIEAAGARLVAQFPTDQSGVGSGAIMMIEKPH